MSSYPPAPDADQRPAATYASPAPVPAAVPIGYAQPASVANGCWARGDDLVTTRDATLPPLCIKCGEPAVPAPIRRTATYVHPALVLLVLLGIIGIVVYVVLVSTIGKKATIRLFLCDKHRRSRLNGILAVTIASLGSIGIGIGLLVTGDRNETVVISGVGLLLVGLLVALIGAITLRLIGAKAVDDNYATWRGCKRPFLEKLPLV